MSVPPLKNVLELRPKMGTRDNTFVHHNSFSIYNRRLVHCQNTFYHTNINCYLKKINSNNFLKFKTIIKINKYLLK